MTATAADLRELHALHQRAKALRDRLSSGPKTLAGRERLLANRQEALRQAEKALKEARAHAKNREVQVQSIQGRIDELKVKLNTVKKQVEYDAIKNQIAHDQHTIGKIEDELLEAYGRIEADAAALATLTDEVKALEADVARLRADLDAQRGPQQAQLKELEAAIVSAEAIIPEDQRDQYRRVVKQRGADAMAAVEDDACHGCYVSITAQMKNELINGLHLVFCKTCGRILYLTETDPNVLRRMAR